MVPPRHRTRVPCRDLRPENDISVGGRPQPEQRIHENKEIHGREALRESPLRIGLIGSRLPCLRTNLPFLSTVMFDGRETIALLTTGATCAANLRSCWASPPGALSQRCGRRPARSSELLQPAVQMGLTEEQKEELITFLNSL